MPIDKAELGTSRHVAVSTMKEVVEKYTATAAVEIVGFGMSKTWETDFYGSGDGKQMRLAGYEALSDADWSITVI